MGRPRRTDQEKPTFKKMNVKQLRLICRKRRVIAHTKEEMIEGLTKDLKLRNPIRAERAKIGRLKAQMKALSNYGSLNKKLRDVFTPPPLSPEEEAQKEATALANLNKRKAELKEEIRAAYRHKAVLEKRLINSKNVMSDSDLSDPDSRTIDCGSESEEERADQSPERVKQKKLTKKRSRKESSMDGESDEDDEDGRGEQQKQPPPQLKTRKQYDPATYPRTGFTRNSSEERTFNRHAERRERGEDSDTPTDLADCPYQTHYHRHRFCGCDHKGDLTTDEENSDEEYENRSRQWQEEDERVEAEEAAAAAVEEEELSRRTAILHDRAAAEQLAAAASMDTEAVAAADTARGCSECERRVRQEQQQAAAEVEPLEPFVTPEEEVIDLAVKEEDISEEEDDERGRRTDTKEKESLPCERDDRCPYTSTSEERRSRHYLNHTLDFPITCPHCSYRTETAFVLRFHLEAHRRADGPAAAVAAVDGPAAAAAAAEGEQAAEGTTRSKKAEKRHRKRKEKRQQLKDVAAAADEDPEAADAAVAILKKTADKQRTKRESRGKSKAVLADFRRDTAVLPEPTEYKSLLMRLIPLLLSHNASIRQQAISTLVSFTSMHGDRVECHGFLDRVLFYTLALLKDTYKVQQVCCSLLIVAVGKVYPATETGRIIAEQVRVVEVPARHYIVSDYAGLVEGIVEARVNTGDPRRWAIRDDYIEQTLGAMNKPMLPGVRAAAGLLLFTLLSKLGREERNCLDQPRLHAALQQLRKLDAALAQKIIDLI